MTEQHAEDLYGPAPTGDEDPHASQAVPDPGETSRIKVSYPPNQVFPARQLCGIHLGQRIRVTEGRNSATGVLMEVAHKGNVINDSPLFGPPVYSLGRTWVELSFAVNHTTHVGSEATVELLD